MREGYVTELRDEARECAGRQAGCTCAAEGLVMQGEVPLQRGVVLHNVSTAAGDDASHHHAWDETPTLRSGPRGTAGIDNGDARPACTYKRTPGQHMLARILTDTQRSCLFFPNTHRHQKHTHTRGQNSPHKKTSLTPRKADSAICRRRGKKKKKSSIM